MKRIATSNMATLYRAGWALAAMLVVWLAVPAPVQAFHFPWDQGHDTTDWNDPKDPGPPDQPPCDPCSGAATRSPVYVSTGYLVWMETDVSIPGRPGLNLARTFNSNDPRDGMFGRGWSTDVETMLLKFSGSTIGTDGGVAPIGGYMLRTGSGKRYVYQNEGTGVFRAPASRFERVVPLADGGAMLVDRDGASKTFNAFGRLKTESDAAGHTLFYEFSGDGRLVRIVDAAGRHLSFSYNTGGRVASVTDSANRTWRYAYDGVGNLVSVTDPANGVLSYQYRQYNPIGDGHSFSQLTRVTDATGVVVIDVVYSNERVASYTEGQNRFSYTYNTTTRTVTKTDLTGSQWVYVYDQNGLVISERDPVGGTSSFQFDSNGRLTRYTDQLGNQWLSTFDALGRMTSSTDPAGARTTYTYQDDLPNPVSVASPSGRETKLVYDGRANLVSAVDPSGAVSTFSWTTTGDLQSSRDPVGSETGYTAELAGLPLTVSDALNRVTTLTYDSAGQVVQMTNADGEATILEYDARGLPSVTIDPSGKTESYERDAAGRVTRIRDAGGRVLVFEYDNFGRLSARVTSDGRRFSLSYRNDNLLSQVTRPDGVVVVYTYDAAKRITSERFGADVVTYAYSPRHQLASATNGTGTVSRTYDSSGRIITETANGQTSTYSYNIEGEHVGTLSVGGATQIARDVRGFPTSIVAPEGTYSLEYDQAGRRTSLTYPNGTRTEYTYDAAGQLRALTSSGPYTASSVHTYAADGLVSNVVSSGNSWTFDYDQDNQITSAATGTESLIYQYDASRNLLGAGRSYDTGNRLVRDDVFDYSYDLNGNLIQKTNRGTGARSAYAWDSRNRLVQVDRFSNSTATSPSETLRYSYDALGRRLSRSVNGAVERFVYDGLDPIVILNATNGVVQRITHGPDTDEPLAIQDSGGTKFLHADRLGSIIAVSDATQVVARYDYEPFGKLRGTASTVKNQFRFTGREFEADDLYYYRARYYDPGMGRYISEDPSGLAGGANPYVYALNNPVRWVDPSGLYAEVKVEGKQVTITIPIEYQGPGAAPAVVQKFNEGIEKNWSGRFGDYDVTAKVVAPSATCPPDKKNTIQVPSGNGRANVNKVGGNTGTWPAERPAWTAAHEAGHLMGLPDQYTDAGGPKTGYNGNIMATHGGHPSASDITNIINANP